MFGFVKYKTPPTRCNDPVTRTLNLLKGLFRSNSLKNSIVFSIEGKERLEQVSFEFCKLLNFEHNHFPKHAPFQIVIIYF